jgi:hypothetical protein
VTLHLLRDGEQVERIYLGGSVAVSGEWFALSGGNQT